MPTMRAVIYTRVSADRSGTARSVGEQEEDCRKVASDNGWRVTHVLTENDRSASRYARRARPEFEKLVDLIERGQVDVLVTWEASRSARDMRVFVTLRDLCRDRGVLWSYSGRTFDLSRTDDRMTTGLDALLAERESDMTRDRVLRSVRTTFEAGKPYGRLLYGYKRIYEHNPTGKPILKEQIPDPETSAVVQEAARRVLAGETPYRISQDFNERGIKPPRGSERGWDLTQIKRICINPGHAGKRTHLGKVVADATWPAIISEADHLALVAKLNDPARRTQKDSKVKHLLTGIMKCGYVIDESLPEEDDNRYCPGIVRVQKNRTHKAYICKDKFHLTRHEANVDNYVEAVMVAYLRTINVAAFTNTDDTESRELSDQLTVLRARLEEHYDAAADGDLSPKALAKVEARLEAQIGELEKKLAGITRSPLLAQVAGPDAEDVWEELEMPQKRELIRLLMDVRMMQVGAGKRTFDPDGIRITWKD